MTAVREAGFMISLCHHPDEPNRFYMSDRPFCQLTPFTRRFV
jgi:hypothetical protein